MMFRPSSPYVSMLLILALFILSSEARDPLAIATSLSEHKAAFTSGTCRGLHEAYTELHKKIIDGQAPQRYVVFVSPPSGIADRFVGIVGAFMVALLTQRALLIAPHPMAFEALYDQPFINWTVPVLASESELGPVMWPPRYRECAKCTSNAMPFDGMPQMNCPACDDDGKSVSYMNWINSGAARDWHMKTNLAKVVPDVHTIYYSSNRGVSVALFHNAYHTRFLHKIGLRPSTAFGCAYNYLFFPKPETLAVVAEEMREVLAADMVIGIQIRTDDRVMMSQDLPETALGAYRRNFECAEALQAAVGGGQDSALKVRWLVVSDSSEMRRVAVSWYGEKVIVYMRSKPTHVSHSATDNMLGSRLAAAEHWMFGMTDYQVVCWWSGYGRTAAMRSVREASVVALTEESVATKCGPGAMESPWQLGVGYSGVRRAALEV